MLDVGPSPGEVDSLLVFVDRLGAAGTDQAVARAHDHVRRAVAGGAPPPGLRRLAEGLTSAGTSELPPLPRRPADDPGSVVAAVRDNPVLVLEDVETDEVVAAVAALVDDGRRVIVTAAAAETLDAVRTGLPAAAADRVVDALPAIAPADLHRLRGLLVTSTPARRARRAQQLPDLAAFPDVAEVASLAAVAARPSSPGTELIAGMLADLDDERRDSVTAVAAYVQRALAALAVHPEPWIWELLGDLVHGRRRSEFDALVQSAAQALATIDDGRDDPPVSVTGTLPDDAVDTLVAYLEFREGGGRTRGPFRSSAQRDVEPVLRVLRIDDRQPATAAELRMVLTHFELAERLFAVDADCAELDLPTPQDAIELAALSGALVDVAAATRSIGALRHDVLFLGSTSPVSAPDVPAAERLALAVLDYRDNGSPALAAERLDGLADALVDLTPAHAAAPEHVRAVDALRRRDAAGYAAAVDDLAGAHRERSDEQRVVALLDALGSPALARAWTGGSEPDVRPDGAAAPGTTVPGARADGPAPPVRFGLAWFIRAEQLLEALPAPDRADVVVVLDAGRLGIDRALLAAAAPRIVATVPSGGRSGSASLLGLLQRASALVIRGRSTDTAARVVQLTPGTRALPIRGGDVEQAGA